MFDLKPHPEGGHFRETFRDPLLVSPLKDWDKETVITRASSTAIYFLLARGERSHWHRIDAAEVWHWLAGAPLQLDIAYVSRVSARREHITLGNDFVTGQRPQAVVPASVWQAAQSLGDWTLVGCTVAPGFEFADFELAPNNWEPR